MKKHSNGVKSTTGMCYLEFASSAFVATAIINCVILTRKSWHYYPVSVISCSYL